MKVPAFLATLRERDIHVWAEGEHLRCSAPASVLTPDLRHELQSRKQDILEFLRCAQALSGQQRALVPLQSRGGRIPVFGVAGHNGDVFCYRALAKFLGEDQPFYGLQPPGLDGHGELMATVEDLAAYFAGQILAFRPAEPYLIAGFCSGGAVAFELAQQLLRRGATISSLALFGCPYPASYRAIPQMRRRMDENLKHVLQHTRKLAALPVGQQPAYVFEKLRARRQWLSSERERQARSDWIGDLRSKVERATIAAARRYQPTVYPGRVNLFHPCREWATGSFQALRWRSVAPCYEEYFGPEGCNADNMLREAYAGKFAKLFLRARETAANNPQRQNCSARLDSSLPI